jgi:hypothetical protein
MELTPLQRRLKASVLLQLRRHKQSWIESISNSHCSQYRFIVDCDGVFDIVTYDKRTKELTVEYTVGVGKGFSFGNPKAGYYDEVETKEFSFNSPFDLENIKR